MSFILTISLFLLYLTLNCQETNQGKPEWGNFKPYLIHSMTQKDLFPITLRFAFCYKDASIPVRYDLKEGESTDLILNYDYHDGQSFFQQSVYDKYTDFHFKIMTIIEKDHEGWETHFMSEELENYISEMLFKRKMGKTQNNDEKVMFGFSLGMEQLMQNITTESKNLYIIKSETDQNAFIIRDKINEENIYIFEIKLLQNGVQTNETFDYVYAGRPDKYDNWNIADDLKTFITLEEKAAYFSNNCKEDFERQTVLFFKVSLKIPSNFLLTLRLKPEKNLSNYSSQTNHKEISKKINTKKQEAAQKFNETFPSPPQYFRCSLSSFSNLLGGLIFAYGPIKTSSSPEVYKDFRSLFTLSPCRKGFARSFLWDDGFHNMLLAQYDPEKSLEILMNWFETVQLDGWLPREQIRGPEVEVYANKDFIVQLEDEANPPTLIIPLNYLLHVFKEKKDYVSIERIKQNLNQVKKWFFWFHNSQKSGEENYLYRWKPSQDGKSYLGSGMDDYPRDDEGFISQYHLDLQVWNIIFAENLLVILRELGAEPDEIMKVKEVYEKSLEKMNINLKDPNDFIYKDSDGIKFSVHFGYDNLLPLAFGLIQKDSKELINLFAAIRDEEKLWSEAGLRSLSKSDISFKKNSDYWTSPVWININYLVLRGIKKFYWDNEIARKIYGELRGNLMGNICGNWKDTGYFWETFDESTLKGTHHFLFNGWTSLITLIISEKYI